MKKGTVITILIIVIVVILGIWWWTSSNNGSQANQPYPTSTANPGTTTAGGPMLPAFDQTISDGTITLHYPSSDFGLATTQSQILATAIIPPCDPDFNDCLYYNNSSTYAGTNFESAGIRIEKRATLTTETECLNTEPSDYTGLTPIVATSSDYATSLFANLSNGAAGNLSSGALYRLYYAPTATCYEFETRIGQTDIGNYPSGSIQEFNAADQAALNFEMQAMLGTVTLASSGQQVVFPSQGSAIVQ